MNDINIINFPKKITEMLYYYVNNNNIKTRFKHYAFLMDKNNSTLYEVADNTILVQTCIPSIHAEEFLIKKITNRNIIGKMNLNRKYNILVIKISPNGTLGFSKPCSHCINKIKNSNVKIDTIHYSNESGNIICEKRTKISNKHICRGRYKNN